MEQADRLSLLAVFAHPDDESFATGGTLARYAREGVAVSLVCATRGEAGEISDPALATPETLGRIREDELRVACSTLGIGEPRFLDYVDATLPDVDRHVAEGKVVRAIRELKPQVVLTWGPEGGYGHPDHVAVHEWATTAFRAAGDPSAFPEQLAAGLQPWSPQKLYYVAMPQERYQRVGEVARRLEIGTTWDRRDWSTFGVPEASVTTFVNVALYADTKLEAVASHQTQFSPRHPYALLPRDLIRQLFHEECFILAESCVGRADGREDDLFRGIRHSP
jgi:N-acetyl-1-D-myo-inositol-2-amino-2-deoxy-alpha-D-glucopyranoside deacetylase